jgi:hypothetical protein
MHAGLTQVKGNIHAGNIHALCRRGKDAGGLTRLVPDVGYKNVTSGMWHVTRVLRVTRHPSRVTISGWFFVELHSKGF